MIRYVVKWKTELMERYAEIGPFEDRKSAEIVEKGLLSSDQPIDVKIEEIRYEFWVECRFRDDTRFSCGPFADKTTAESCMHALHRAVNLTSSQVRCHPKA